MESRLVRQFIFFLVLLFVWTVVVLFVSPK